MTATELLLQQENNKLKRELQFYRQNPMPPFNGDSLELTGVMPNPYITIPLYMSITKTDGIKPRVIIKTEDGIYGYYEYTKEILHTLDKTEFFDFMIRKLTELFVTQLMKEMK